MKEHREEDADDALIKKYIKTGNSNYFEPLVERYERYAYVYAYSLLKNEFDAQDVVADARKVRHAAAADQDHRVFLKVVAFTGDVAHRLDTRGQAHLGDFTKRRVRLLRGRRVNAGADAAALGRALQGGHLVAAGLGLTRLADQLIDRRHEALFSWGRVP